jgi:thiol-disulfide isomerase/thioredoxin
MTKPGLHVAVLWMWILLVSIASAVEQPLLIELFTTDRCNTCSIAEQALLALEEEYEPDQLLILAYHVNDPKEVLTGFVRARYYGVNALPMPSVIFNGQTRITGANENVYQSYKNMITNILGRESEFSLDGDFWLKNSVLSASVQVESDVTETKPLSAIFVLLEKPFGSALSIVRDVTIQPIEAGGDVHMKVKSIDLLGYSQIWGVSILQDLPGKGVLQTKKLRNRSAIGYAFNHDDSLDKNDLFYFMRLWSQRDASVDLNRDAHLNSLDILRMMRPD